MATYTKTVWNTGDLITAEKMNKVETQLETVTPGATGAVRSDTSQSLSDTEKATARTNIAAASTADITTLTNNLNSTETSIAPAFSTSTAYAVGDLVIYNNKLYRFTIAHAAGAWNTDQVEEVNVSDMLENKADINGYYEGMGVGTADQLAATQYVEDNEPYVFRTSGGTADIGASVEEMLVGGTIAWNQLVQNGNFENDLHWGQGYACSSVSFANGEATFTTSAAYGQMSNSNRIAVTASHVYLCTVTAKCANARNMAIGSTTLGLKYSPIGSTYTTIYSLNKPSSSIAEEAILIVASNSVNGDSFTVKNAMILDLTKMFGSTIADYIYGLETANASDGVAFFRKLFPKPYYAYNTGELISVAAAKKEAVGFNAWDEEWDVGRIAASTGQDANTGYDIRSKNYIPVLPNTTYCFTNTDTGNVWYYDINKQFISVHGAMIAGAPTFTTPSNCYFIRFCTLTSSITTYDPAVNPVCINLSWSGYRDGEYEPYNKFTTDFDSNLELRGIVKLDANNNLYYDGDTYESDGTVTRKYGVVDLGTRGWSYQADYNLFYATLPTPSVYRTSNLFTTAGYSVYTAYYTNAPDKSMFVSVDSPNFIGIKDSTYTDAATFKAAMSGVYLVYELATPTTETVTPFTKTQWVDDFGTEQFYDSKVLAGSRDVSMPVGHESKYLANLRDKLQHLPELAEEDGDYYIRQKDKQMELVNFADGYNHPNGVVGTAQQLESTIYEEDKVPYAYRTSGGSADIGNRVDEEIVGGTVAWNQLVTPPSQGTTTSNGVTFSFDGQGKTTCVGSLSGTWAYGAGAKYGLDFIKGHIYMLTGCPAGGEESTLRLWTNSSIAFPVGYRLFDIGNGKILDALGDETGCTLQIMISNTYTGDISKLVFVPQLFDLTQMFGSTIANYVYSLETATAGAGVAWFKSLFPADYYAYNAGELMSVQAVRKETVGFNQWDEEWTAGGINTNTGVDIVDTGRFRSINYIPIFPSERYYAKAPANIYLFFYDKDKNYIGYHGSSLMNATFVPKTLSNDISTNSISFENARYIRFRCDTATYNHDICINLSWSGTRNGEYEPYQKLSHELGDVELRGIPKLDANNKLYYDGDTYSSDGKVVRKYGIVDLGTLNWIPLSTYYYAHLPQISIANTWNAITTKYPRSIYTNGQSLTNEDKVFGIGLTSITTEYDIIFIKDTAYADVASLKASLNGVYCVYELATPTEETSTPYANPSPVDDWGTEEFIDRAVEAGERDVSVPVGHDSKYMANLRDKLQHLPNLAENNGMYVISQNNSSMTLVPLTTPTELPAAPTSDGTYKLRCVVSSSTATYSWVADS